MKVHFLCTGHWQVCDLVVEHKSSSRVHACVAHDSQGKAWLLDLGSVHGVNLLFSDASLVSSQTSAVRHACLKGIDSNVRAGAVDLSRTDALPNGPALLGAEALTLNSA